MQHIINPLVPNFASEHLRGWIHFQVREELVLQRNLPNRFVFFKHINNNSSWTPNAFKNNNNNKTAAATTTTTSSKPPTDHNTENQRSEELLIAAQQCGVVLPDLFVAKIAYSLSFAAEEAQRGRLVWQQNIAPNIDPKMKEDVFKSIGDNEGARRAAEASHAAASGHGHEPKAMGPKPPPPKSAPAEPASSSSYATPTSAPSQKAKFPQKAMPAKAAPKPSRPPPSEKPQQAPQKKKTNQ